MLIAFCICPPLNSYPYLASRITTSAMLDWPSFNSRANDWTDMYLNLALGPGITSNACFDEKSPINFESVFSSFLRIIFNSHVSTRKNFLKSLSYIYYAASQKLFSRKILTVTIWCLKIRQKFLSGQKRSGNNKKVEGIWHYGGLWRAQLLK